MIQIIIRKGRHLLVRQILRKVRVGQGEELRKKLPV
jgi:hypothetical protein